MQAISTHPKIMHGTPCFSGTRVAIQTLFDWLEEGHDTAYFLKQFPSVRREQVTSVLEQAGRRTVEAALSER